MVDSLWDLLLKKENLLEQAKKNALSMLVTGKEMFITVLAALKENTTDGIMGRIRATDKDVNALQIETRKMIYEHLALSKGKDLLTGLQLVNIVIDLERIGDYSKNIGELTEIFPGRLNLGDKEEEFFKIKEMTLELFDLTNESFKGQDVEKAHLVLRKYDTISKDCDYGIKRIFQSDEMRKTEKVEKHLIAYSLILRYIKRVNAHLKNVASTVANPFHRIGYRHSVP